MVGDPRLGMTLCYILVIPGVLLFYAVVVDVYCGASR